VRPTPTVNWVTELARVEAWQSSTRFLSTADLLAGILRAGDSLTCQLLVERGVTPEALRAAAVPFSIEEDSTSDVYYDNEKKEFAPMWKRVWACAADTLR
jgi:hypothetical protein